MQAFERFEQEWSKYTGCDHVVGCSSGTAALHLACEDARQSLRFSQSSKAKAEIIVPDYAMIACARAVSLANMKPVFVDCDKSLCIDPNKLEESITDNTLGIMAVHTYGRECNMPAIHELAGKYGLYVIEDLAEAHLTRPHPNTHAACWSFYKNKLVYGEEGGAVAFRHKVNADVARRRRSLGFTEDHNYWHEPRGHNYRLSNAHATCILTNFPQIDTYVNLFTRLRRKQEAIYDAECPDDWKQSSVGSMARVTPWVYDIRIPDISTGKQRQIVELLRYYSIQARYGFRPLSLQPEYIYKTYPDAGPLTISNIQDMLHLNTEAYRAAREVIYLPLAQSLPDGWGRDQAREAFVLIKGCLS